MRRAQIGGHPHIHEYRNIDLEAYIQEYGPEVGPAIAGLVEHIEWDAKRREVAEPTVPFDGH